MTLKFEKNLRAISIINKLTLKFERKKRDIKKKKPKHGNLQKINTEIQRKENNVAKIQKKKPGKKLLIEKKNNNNNKDKKVEISGKNCRGKKHSLRKIQRNISGKYSKKIGARIQRKSFRKNSRRKKMLWCENLQK